jgi:polyisoprenoid-binding protein YceI
MIWAALALLMAPAGEKTYYFGADDRHTVIRFEARAAVGTLMGYTRKVSGSASIDFEGGSGKCALSVPVASMTTGVVGIDNALRMKTWMDAEGFPALEFKAAKASRGGDPRTWTVDGQWTMKGVTKDLSVTAEVVPVPDGLAKQARLGEGEWVRVRARWVLKLSDFGIRIPEKSVLTVDDAWTVTVNLLGTTAKPLAAGAFVPPEEDMKVVRAEKVEPPEGAGKRYKMGKKPQFSSLAAESATEAGSVLALSKIVGGYVLVDGEKGRVKLNSPAKALKTGIEDLDRKLMELLDAAKCPQLKFESTEISKKDDRTWAVKGNLELRGVSKPVSCEAAMRKVTAEQMAAAGWGEKEAVGFATTLRIRLSDFGITVPEDLSDEWTLGIDLLAEAEE